MRRAGGILLKLLLVVVVLVTVWLIYLDAQVTRQFEGKRWALPAKVYARPLELYPGKSLTLNALVWELQQLGYQPDAAVPQPGSYHRDGNRVILHSRSFQLWDEQLPAQRITVVFNGQSINRLEVAGKVATLLSLEPIAIGGIYPAHGEDRSLVRIDQVPQFVVDTLISVEDQDFYRHWGISLKAMARALWVNVRAGRVQQGGSTLTQQLVKNFYLSSERSIARKAVEAVMAVLLEWHYSKEEILEAYLNEVYLGQAGARAIHGFGLGSHYYFGRDLNELKLHQAAWLVALVKGPSY